MNKLILGKNSIYEENKNINNHTLICGSTGSGKTTSLTIPKILYSENSLVIPQSKRNLYLTFKPYLEAKGYRVEEINLVNPSLSTCGFNFLDKIQTEMDINNIASLLISNSSKTMLGETDPYWSNASKSVLTGLIGYAYLDAKNNGKMPNFNDVLALYKTLKVNFSGNKCVTNLDYLFDILETNHPESSIPKHFRILTDNASKTSACIYSMVSSILDKFLDLNLRKIFSENILDLSLLGEEKIALFITTSPINPTSKYISDILYSHLFKTLLSKAYLSEKGYLEMPVSIICDDFAVGNPIPDFDQYISVCREFHIDVSINIQSLSQLESLYGRQMANTIINNFDNIVYLSCLDLQTAEEISIRLNKPLENVFTLPFNDIVIIRRGEKAKIEERFNTFEDEMYLKAIDLSNILSNTQTFVRF